MSWQEEMIAEIKATLKSELKKEILQELNLKPTQAANYSVGVEEARKILGVSRNTFMSLVKTGKIPYTMAGAHYRFDQRDLEHYKSKNKSKKKVKGIA